MDAAGREAATAFADAVALWRLDAALREDVIAAATDCLVVGLATPNLLVLAGVPSYESTWVVEPLVRETLEELGLSADAMDAPRVQRPGQ